MKFVLYDLKIKLMQKQKMLWVYWKCQRTIILQLGIRTLAHSAARYYDFGLIDVYKGAYILGCIPNTVLEIYEDINDWICFLGDAG